MSPRRIRPLRSDVFPARMTDSEAEAEAAMDTAPSTERLAARRPRWRRVMLGGLREAVRDQVALAAAGCGFYATLALFPAISMLVSVYGLAFDAQAVEQQLAVVRNLLP